MRTWAKAINLAVSVGTRSAVTRGPFREEVVEAMGIYRGAGPSIIDASKAVEACDQFKIQAAATPDLSRKRRRNN